jgi:hypothetical protein
MIEREILEIITDPNDDGQRLNDIADEFRLGRDVGDIILLLDSDNAELVSIGAWFLKEIPLDLYWSEPFLSRLHRLTTHADPAVRFDAFGALFPTLNAEEPTTLALVRKLLRDPNKGVRMSAESGAARLGLTRETEGPE